MNGWVSFQPQPKFPVTFALHFLLSSSRSGHCVNQCLPIRQVLLEQMHYTQQENDKVMIALGVAKWHSMI